MPEEEKNEQESEQKARMASEMHKRLAEQHASAFEAWLKDHQDATTDEAHKRLVETIEAAIMFGLMSLMMM